jgi:hypothetical protein
MREWHWTEARDFIVVADRPGPKCQIDDFDIWRMQKEVAKIRQATS